MKGTGMLVVSLRVGVLGKMSLAVKGSFRVTCKEIKTTYRQKYLMIRPLPSLKVTVLLFVCFLNSQVSFRGLYKLQQRPDWSLCLRGLSSKFPMSIPVPSIWESPQGNST